MHKPYHIVARPGIASVANFFVEMTYSWRLLLLEHYRGGREGERGGARERDRGRERERERGRGRERRGRERGGKRKGEIEIERERKKKRERERKCD